MLPRAISSRVAYVPGTGFYADGSGSQYVSPGMTETSTLPLALEAWGHSFGSTCVSLLEQAAARGA
jgi:hypothetical protein